MLATLPATGSQATPTAQQLVERLVHDDLVAGACALHGRVLDVKTDATGGRCPRCWGSLSWTATPAGVELVEERHAFQAFYARFDPILVFREVQA